MGVSLAPAVAEDFGNIGLVVAVGVFHEKNVGGHRDNGSIIGQNDAGRNIEAVGKNRKLVGLAIAVGVLANLDAVVGFTVGFFKGVGIIDRLYHPEPTALVPGHGDGVDDVGIGGKKLYLEIG